MVIPVANYNELKNEPNEQFESLIREIDIFPASYLSEAVEIAFDIEKIKKKVKAGREGKIYPSPITVPHPTELFQSRETDIAEILELISCNKITAVTGSPGQGKTEVVRAVAHVLAAQSKFPAGIFWASNREDEREYPLKSLDNIFNAVLKGKGVPEAEKIHQAEKKKQVSEVLESGRALLILDNFEAVDKDEDIIAYLSDLSPNTRLLIATRHDLGPALAQKYTLNSLSDDGLCLFLKLLEKTGYLDSNQITPEDESWAKEICQFLNGHPLSLILAAGNASYNSLEEIAQRLQKNPYSILQSKNRPVGTPVGLWKSIDLSLARLDPTVRELFLKLSIFFAPVSFGVIQAVLGENDLDELLRELGQRNLLNRDKKGQYFFLPVLRIVSQDLLKRSNIDVRGCHRKTADYFKKQAVPESARALDHLKWFYKQGDKQAGQELVNFMLDNEGTLFARGYWNLDEEKLNQALTVSQEINFQEGEIDLLTRLGWLVHHKWDLDKADELHQRAIKVCKKLKDQVRIAYQWKHLGWVYTDKGNLDKAKEFYRKSLEIQEREKHYHNQADIWNAIGTIYRKQGKLDQAERAILYALHLATKKIKKKHRHLMRRIWSNLGMQYWAQGRLEQANRFLLKSLHSAERSGNVPVQIDNLRNLGQIYLSQGELGQAEQAFEKLLSLAEQAETLRFQAAACHHLAQIHRARGNFVEAEGCHKKELNIHIKRDHLKRQAGSWCNLGVIYRDSKRFEEAEDAHKKSQAIHDKLNSNSGTNWHKLGLIYNDQGKLDEAEQAFSKALKVYEKREYTPCLVREWNNLARVYRRQGKIEEANRALEKSLLFVGQLDSTSLSRFYTDIFCDLGHTCIKLGKFEQAEQILKRILEAKKHISKIFG